MQGKPADPMEKWRAENARIGMDATLTGIIAGCAIALITHKLGYADGAPLFFGTLGGGFAFLLGVVVFS